MIGPFNYQTINSLVIKTFLVIRRLVNGSPLYFKEFPVSISADGNCDGSGGEEQSNPFGKKRRKKKKKMETNLLKEILDFKPTVKRFSH